jgi:hypothetical protein
VASYARRVELAAREEAEKKNPSDILDLAALVALAVGLVPPMGSHESRLLYPKSEVQVAGNSESGATFIPPLQSSSAPVYFATSTPSGEACALSGRAESS